MGGPGSGRKRDPDRLRLLGSRTDRSPNAPAPVGEPVMPDWLGRQDAIEHWQVVVPRLVAMGVVGAADSEALAAMCDHWADYMAAQREGHMPAKASAHKQWLNLAGRFGMTPHDRGKIHLSGDQQAKGGVMSRQRA